MRGNVETIKERLDIVEVISSYTKLEKAGSNLKGRCPFHNEKTASFSVSPSRQSFYCFGCGMKGDMFNFVQEIEGVDFRQALKILADKAHVELEFVRPEVKTEKDKLLEALDLAATFFEGELSKHAEALEYLSSRGVSEESQKTWRIGYAPKEWRALYGHLTALGITKDIILKAGLAKYSAEETGKSDSLPYDVFRGRVMFPLSDQSGRIIAFSGRALEKDAIPKYLNTPDTVLFTKSEVLYGLDKAKEDIRKKDYSVLVEGQMDLVLSHQAGVKNTVASSGTAFTATHLDRLKRLSTRLILAFDGDNAGEKAAEKSAVLGLSLGMEVKVAKLPEGKDPAELIKADPEEWKEALRKAQPAIEHFLGTVLSEEKDNRKAGKLIEKKILPMLTLLASSIERSHFVSLIAKRAGLREEAVWDDLRRAKPFDLRSLSAVTSEDGKEKFEPILRKSNIQQKLMGIIFWQESQEKPVIDVPSLRSELENRLGAEYYKKLRESVEIEKEIAVFEAESYYSDQSKLNNDIAELLNNLSNDLLREERNGLITLLSRAEGVSDEQAVKDLTGKIQDLNQRIRALEGK